MFQKIFENVRQSVPLIHSITNYVTANDCANMLLACGASPIMADEPQEAAEITALCSGLCINIGTLNRRTIPAMLAAGKQAGISSLPAVLDPVGTGASQLRTDIALQLLQEVHFTAIRGNISEIKALALGSGATRGVDAAAADRVTEKKLEETVTLAKSFAGRTGAVIAITGAADIVADSEWAFCIHNGHPMMSRVTGTGCQLSALMAAFLAANPTEPLKAAAAAVCAMGLCGELACQRLAAWDGNASYRTYLIDAMYQLTPAQLEKGAHYEVR